MTWVGKGLTFIVLTLLFHSCIGDYTALRAFLVLALAVTYTVLVDLIILARDMANLRGRQ